MYVDLRILNAYKEELKNINKNIKAYYQEIQHLEASFNVYFRDKDFFKLLLKKEEELFLQSNKIDKLVDALEEIIYACELSEYRVIDKGERAFRLKNAIKLMKIDTEYLNDMLDEVFLL